MLRLLIITITFYSCFSCNEVLKIKIRDPGSQPSLSIIQNSITPVDNIELNAQNLLASTGRVESSTYILTSFTLSKFSNSPIVIIKGKYDDPLSAADITALASIGLTDADETSTKGDIRGLSKNKGEAENLAFNIKINSSLYTDSTFRNLISSSSESILYVDGDNHIDGEFFTPVNGEYYILQEWISTQLSAYQLLPENNYRKIAIGDTPDDRMDELQFDPALPQVNGHDVGYTYFRRGTLDAYKVTNDGTGIGGWQFTSMGVPFGANGLRYWLVAGLGQQNGETIFLGTARFSYYRNQAINIINWNGTSWDEAHLGDAFFAAVGSPWVPNNSRVSRPIKGIDGSYWLAITEYTESVRAGTDFEDLVLKDLHLMRMTHNSGSFTDPANWTVEAFRAPITSTASFRRSNVRAIYISEYTNSNNFTAYIAAYGVGKFVRSNGVSTYSPIATNPSLEIYNTSDEFPIGLDTNGLQQVQAAVEITPDLTDSKKLMFLGYLTIYVLDTRTDEMTEIFGKGNRTTVHYSR